MLTISCLMTKVWELITGCCVCVYFTFMYCRYSANCDFNWINWFQLYMKYCSFVFNCKNDNITHVCSWCTNVDVLIQLVVNKNDLCAWKLFSLIICRLDRFRNPNYSQGVFDCLITEVKWYFMWKMNKVLSFFHFIFDVYYSFHINYKKNGSVISIYSNGALALNVELSVFVYSCLYGQSVYATIRLSMFKTALLYINCNLM